MQDIYKTILTLGYPSLYDTTNGGIAIWNRLDLKRTKFKFLKRVEVINENLVSHNPVNHISNTYIWVYLPLSSNQINQVLSLSNNFMYDRLKDVLIVRSSNVHRCIALASLIKLYSQGEVSMNKIYSKDLCKKYFIKAKQKRLAHKFRKLLRD